MTTEIKIEKITDMEMLVKLASDGKLKGVYEIDEDLYHAGPGHSSTDHRKYMKSGLAYKWYKDGPKSDTEAMAFGRLVHTSVLEYDQLEARFVVKPADLGKGTGGRKKAAEWKEQNKDRTIINADQAAAGNEMNRSVCDNPKFMNMLKAGHPELAAYAVDPVSGVLLKAKGDLVVFEKGLIIDVKTCTDARPEQFSRKINEFGYHIQAAYYLDIFTLATGIEFNHFVMMAMEYQGRADAPKGPFDSRLFFLQPESIEKGRSIYREYLQPFSEDLAKDQWTGYPKDIEPLNIPKWALNN